MEARHAVQSALRTATSSTRVTAALLAMRRASPGASSIIRLQSSASTGLGSAPDTTPAAKGTTASPTPAWPVPSTDKTAPRLDTRSPMSWIKPRSTIGGRSGSGPDVVERIRMLKNYKLPASRSSPIGDAFANEATGAMANLPSPQFFDHKSFMDAHRIRAAAKEWNKRLRPVLGRTVPCTTNVDAARAFQLLQMLVKRNSVQHDFFRQRFHERAGLRRKRLKSQRWRARFRVGFQATVKRVQQLVKQGW